MRRFLRISGIFLLCMFGAFGLLVTGILSIETMSPLKVDKVILTDGSRTVTYLSMVHIGSPHFYAWVKADIMTEKEAGATYLYESVRGTDEQSKQVVSLISSGAADGVELNKLYELIALVSHLQFQPQRTFMGLVNDRDVNADTTFDVVLSDMREHPEHAHHAPDSATSSAPNPPLSNEKIEEVRSNYASLPKPWRKALAFLARDMASIGLRASDGSSMPYKEEIGDARTHVLAQHILSGSGRMVVTYGAAHLPGLIDDLKAANPAWHEVSRQGRAVFQ